MHIVLWKEVYRIVFLAVIAFIFGLEFFVKRHMDKDRALFDGQRELAGGKIILKKYYNTGAAGNFLSGHPKIMVCLHAAVLAAVGALCIQVFQKKDAAVAKLGLSFLVGGGLSNLHDRITKGHVVDYISFGFGPGFFRKLVFNTADFFVFAGVLVILYLGIHTEGQP